MNSKGSNHGYMVIVQCNHGYRHTKQCTCMYHDKERLLLICKSKQFSANKRQGRILGIEIGGDV